MPTFAELGLSEQILEALDELGYKQPTPIQEQAIPALLGGGDVIGQAQTGTGKTAAFGLPMLDNIDPDLAEVQGLVLTPTRELCIQVTQALRAYGAKRGIEVVATFGGAPIRTQMAQLKAGPQVVVGTVGRVMDLQNRHALYLTSARFVVLDEADEMLDLGFLEDVQKILSACPNGRQTALFSATMPVEIKRLAEDYLYHPETIKVKAPTLTIDTVEHFAATASKRDKPKVLAQVIESEKPRQVIVFVRTKISADKLARDLGNENKRLNVKALHGDMSQGSRDGVMISFKEGRVPVLVATDIAARGLDVEHVTHVINYDVPNSAETYTHRIGRTGRVGRTGRAITLVEPGQTEALEDIERHINVKLQPWEPGASTKDDEKESKPKGGSAKSKSKAKDDDSKSKSKDDDSKSKSKDDDSKSSDDDLKSKDDDSEPKAKGDEPDKAPAKAAAKSKSPAKAKTATKTTRTKRERPAKKVDESPSEAVEVPAESTLEITAVVTDDAEVPEDDPRPRWKIERERAAAAALAGEGDSDEDVAAEAVAEEDSEEPDEVESEADGAEIEAEEDGSDDEDESSDDVTESEAEDELAAEVDDEAAEDDDSRDDETPEADAESAEDEPASEIRRPRHIKPSQTRIDEDSRPVILNVGSRAGVTPADVVKIVAERGDLSGDLIRNVRVLERFTLIHVPADQADSVAAAVNGADLGGASIAAEASLSGV